MSKAIKQQTVTVSLPPQHYQVHNNYFQDYSLPAKQHPLSRDHHLQQLTMNNQSGGNATNHVFHQNGSDIYHHRIGNALIHQTYTQEGINSSVSGKKKASLKKSKNEAINTTSKKSVPKSVIHQLNPNKNTGGKYFTKDQLMQIVKDQQPQSEFFNAVSHFNGGIFANGNFTHRSSVDSHFVFAGALPSTKKINDGESKQLAYQKQKRDISAKTGGRAIKTSQSQTRKQVGAQSASKASITNKAHHVKGTQSQYTSVGPQNQFTFQRKPLASALTSLQQDASSPPQKSISKQRSSLKPRHLLLSNASANNKALNVRELESSPPSLNFTRSNNVPQSALKPQIHHFMSRDCSPTANLKSQGGPQTSVKKKVSQQPQKFVRQPKINNYQQTPIKSQQALSVPVIPQSQKKQQKKIKDTMVKQVIPGASTFDMQIKRQKTTVGSPPPKKQGVSRTNGPKAILSTVPKKTSTSKITSQVVTNSLTAKKAPSSSKFDRAAQITMGVDPNKESQSPLVLKQKFQDLYRVSEEKMGSGGSNGSYIHKFIPSNFLAPSQFNVKEVNQSDMLPVVSHLIPQLNQIQIPFTVENPIIPQSSPIINIKKNVLNQQGLPPPQAPLSMVDSIHLKSQSHSIINRNVIDGERQSPLATVMYKQQSAKENVLISGPSPKMIGAQSPPTRAAEYQSPFSKQSQTKQNSTFSKAALEQLLSSAQLQNRELLNNILNQLTTGSQKQSPNLQFKASDASPQISNDRNQLKTPVNNLKSQNRRRSSSKNDGKLTSILASSSAPPSSTSSKTDSKNSALPDKQTFLLQHMSSLNQKNLPSPPMTQPYQVMNPFHKHQLSQTSDAQNVVQSSYSLMTPNPHLQGAQTAIDKENVMILSNNTENKNNLSKQQSTKVALKYNKNEEQQNKKGNQQKTTKKENNENNAPLRIVQKNNGTQQQMMASSVSIFHQVMSETPLRRKNSGGRKGENNREIFSNQKEPLREINFNANHQSNPQTLKSGFDKKQFDISVGDFYANGTEKTPQPKQNIPSKLDHNLHHQLLEEGIQQAQNTPNPFLNMQQQLALLTNSSHSSYQSLGAPKNIWTSSNSSSLQRVVPVQQTHVKEMIILDQKMVSDNNPLAIHLRKKSIDNLSERSDLKSRTSGLTVVKDNGLVKKQKQYNMTFTINSSDRKASSSKAYLSNSIIGNNPDLIMSSNEKSRSNNLQNKMPTVFLHATQVPSVRDNPLRNPLIYQAQNSYKQSLDSSMSGASSSCLSSNEERGMKQLNNSMVDAEDMQRMVEAKLHHLQFEKVFCTSNHHRDDLMAYFIRRHQIQMGLIPPRDPNDSCCSSTDEVLSGMSNFSLEIEMLNRLHVEKNNRNKLSQLPVVIDHLLPDPSLSLYQEEPNEDGICFSKDERPRIHFKDPITKTKNQLIRYNNKEESHRQQDLFEGSLTQQLTKILPIQHAPQRQSASSQGYHFPSHNGATGLDDYNFHDRDLCLKMENKYYESSEEEVARCDAGQGTKQSCGCSNEKSDGQKCLRCQRNQAAILKRIDYYSSSSSALAGASSSFSDRPKKCRRRIDKQFTSSGDFNNCPAFEHFIPDAHLMMGENQQLIDLQDIRVQPFGGWGDEALFSEDEKNQYLQPEIIKRSSVEPKVKMNFDQIMVNHNDEKDFDQIQEISHLSNKSGMLSHLYHRQNEPQIVKRQSNPNQDLEFQYLEQLELHRQMQTASHQSANQQELSYDFAIKDYKWLHETNNAMQQQDALDQILMMSGPVGGGQITTELANYQLQIAQINSHSGSGGTQDQWLMRPLQEQQPLHFQMTNGGNKKLLGSDDSSPKGGINMAPVKKRGMQAPSSCSQSSKWSSAGERKQIKSASQSSEFGESNMSDRVALALFRNPQVIQNIEESRKMFEGCESIKSQKSFTSNASSTQGVPLSFESKEEAQIFLGMLQQKLNVGPISSLENLKILPGIKTLQAHEIIRVETCLRPAVYDQVPLNLAYKNSTLEEFDFDQLLFEIELQAQQQQQPAEQQHE